MPARPTVDAVFGTDEGKVIKLFKIDTKGDKVQVRCQYSNTTNMINTCSTMKGYVKETNIPKCKWYISNDKHFNLFQSIYFQLIHDLSII